MEKLKLFENPEFGTIRTVVIDDKPWFVGKDVAEDLGYSNPSSAVSKNVDAEDKTTLLLEQDGSNYKSRTTFINESGLYSLIMSSKLPNAKKFKHWVTSEVLPSIRKTGSYSVKAETPSYQIADPIERAMKWIEEEKVRQSQAKQLEEQKPLVEFADHVSKSVNSIDMGTFAKLLYDENICIGRNKLFKWMKSNKYLMFNKVPYQKYIKAGYFDVIEQTYKTPYGEKKIATKTLITGKGQIYFTEKLRNEYRFNV